VGRSINKTSIAACKIWKQNVGEVLVSGRALSTDLKAAQAVIVKQTLIWNVLFISSGFLYIHQDLPQWFPSWYVPKFQILLGRDQSATPVNQLFRESGKKADGSWLHGSKELSRGDS
jgi:hypothetical protein